jgi:cytochrome c oxidase cbb3-type subunit I
MSQTMNSRAKFLLSGIILMSVSLPVRAKGPEDEMAIYPAMVALLMVLFALIGIVLWIVLKARNVFRSKILSAHSSSLDSYLKDLDQSEITFIIEARKARSQNSGLHNKAHLLLIGMFLSLPLFAHASDGRETLLSQPGIVITMALVAIPLILGIVFLISKINRGINRYLKREKEHEAQRLAEYLLNTDEAHIAPALLKRKEHFADHSYPRLADDLDAEDPKAIIQNPATSANIPFVATKKKAEKKSRVEPGHSKLILWYFGTAIFWLVFGTSVGWYLGVKFVAPDIDHQSWLSFGRLRPVHTNAVFWGWSSLALLGLAHYVVPIVSNSPLASLRKGWISVVLINMAVFIGSLCLMIGINNGGGEYREYIWPVMGLFGAGLVLTLFNFIQTIARRTSREIYISNWYIVSAIMFTLVIAFIAYWPSWQNGLGETIVQGYYMHQGVGMWFMLFSLGIVYYFLPQQLNKPIYSYSLGILAFWTQIIFYTVIGTHHFVFSAIPWWLQTVAIVGSAGMVIPVIAGTTNFFMTFKGDFNKIRDSYTLPFFVVGIVFYFTGSLQGTAEAFRYTNLLWHFTDFTVAHSHITMYGIIAFLLWGSIYALVPRLTENEPSQLMVGAHFWTAFIGLLLYAVPLMIGGTLKGLMWMNGKPFMDSVQLMAPYWLWRAIGGTMMWLSHLVFAYNFYRMITSSSRSDIKELAFEKIKLIKKQEEHETLVNS